MHIFILVIFILSQIVINFFLITSFVAFHDQIMFLGIPVHLILIFVLNIGSLLLIAKIFKDEENRIIQFTESTHEEQYQALVTSVRSDRHDLNNHLTVVAGLIKINNYTSAANYIDEFIGEVKLNNQFLTIKHPVLASILFSKTELFKNQRIPFQINIKSETLTTKITSTDLIRLISNLLDNAYEATIELPKEAQKVVFEMIEDNQHFAIITRNTSKHKEVDNRFLHAGYSTKTSEKKVRGYGLPIIKEITHKYGGALSIENVDSFINFKLSFPKEKAID